VEVSQRWNLALVDTFTMTFEILKFWRGPSVRQSCAKRRAPFEQEAQIDGHSHLHAHAHQQATYVLLARATHNFVSRSAKMVHSTRFSTQIVAVQLLGKTLFPKVVLLRFYVEILCWP